MVIASCHIKREFRNVDNVAQSCILHDKGAQRELLLTQQNLSFAIKTDFVSFKSKFTVLHPYHTINNHCIRFH